MRKIYSILFIVTAMLSRAQSVFEVRDQSNGNALVSNNQIFTKTTFANGTDYTFYFQVKNVSASTKTLIVRKFENSLNSTPTRTAEAYFCFDGACYIPTTLSATIALPAAGTFSFLPKLDEADAIGTSNVTYEISDFNNGSDALSIELRYNTSTGLKEQALYRNLSGIYPNPVKDNAYIEVNSVKELNGQEYMVYNSLGAVVKKSSFNVKSGKNVITINTDGLESGIYFVAFNNGNTVATKKMIITK